MGSRLTERHTVLTRKTEVRHLPSQLMSQNVKEIVDWWERATTEEREDLLYLLGGYAVSEETWYVHPRKDEDAPVV